MCVPLTNTNNACGGGMTYLENSPSLNPLKYKASVKMDGALKQGVIASIEYALQIRLVRQKCLTIIHTTPKFNLGMP